MCLGWGEWALADPVIASATGVGNCSEQKIRTGRTKSIAAVLVNVVIKFVRRQQRRRTHLVEMLEHEALVRHEDVFALWAAAAKHAMSRKCEVSYGHTKYFGAVA